MGEGRRSSGSVVLFEREGDLKGHTIDYMNHLLQCSRLKGRLNVLFKGKNGNIALPLSPSIREMRTVRKIRTNIYGIVSLEGLLSVFYSKSFSRLKHPPHPPSILSGNNRYFQKHSCIK